MTKKTKEISTVATTEPTGYLALNDFDFNRAIASEMDGLNAVFDRIRMPSGGTTVFQIPSDNPEEPELEKEITAVILYHHPIRAYFKDKYTGGINPPDCGSLDSLEGFGNPGGNCSTCLLNAFGTGENNSKACKERRRLYLLREGELFPVMLSLPTGSLKEFSRYIMRCLSKGYKSNAIVTRISLTKATNKGGIAYAKAVFHMERKLTPEESVLVERLSEQIKNISQKVGWEEATPEETGNAKASDGISMLSPDVITAVFHNKPA